MQSTQWLIPAFVIQVGLIVINAFTAALLCVEEFAFELESK
jgi:hypothetical protein